jgi:hypothetical protein
MSSFDIEFSLKTSEVQRRRAGKNIRSSMEESRGCQQYKPERRLST